MTQHHNDLIRRLRNARGAIEGPNIAEEAADRIRALEAALRLIADAKDSRGCNEIARQALAAEETKGEQG